MLKSNAIIDVTGPVQAASLTIRFGTVPAKLAGIAGYSPGYKRLFDLVYRHIACLMEGSPTLQYWGICAIPSPAPCKPTQSGGGHKA